MITIQIDARDALRKLNDIEKRHVPFALSLAIYNTAREVQADLATETRVFDRPRPGTVNGTYLFRADKRSLTAVVGLRRRAQEGQPVQEYLQAEVEGGARPFKRSEILLERAGILPAGMQTRPGSGARLDAYGNMSRGQVVQIISYFKAFGGLATSGRKRGKAGTETKSQALNRPAKKPRRALEFFVVPEGMAGLATGVWERRGKKVAPILIFIRRPVYRAIYGFERVALGTVRSKFQPSFDQAMRRALETAR